ncbi:GIY-YIG nuclease family protein [Crocosphaera sp. UHCC 0190]|uniref:GIY-YIG nuclease family protein n=1 Tax=Crocosphaera sp. UHCC 0190 TaxID=3110246 RepID=UPI002B2042DD|nr:GIY-YIG nuclease family protein [Crocosphaera sp. UHCC 0190]MEA5509848.1 GIY-YIG nuclease family protein [Crocosphaera sp. UHCC 0190]
MTTHTEIPTLNSLEYLPYLDKNGLIAEDLQGKIGVYSIFDQEKNLKFVGYSRDIYSSLKQHLIRQPNYCYWLKVQTITRPSRTILEEIKNNWIAENGDLGVNNEKNQAAWTQPIDAKPGMTAEEKETYNKSDELTQTKLLKQVARRVEAEIIETLKNRGNQMEIRFNPKLKGQGLLDLK